MCKLLSFNWIGYPATNREIWGFESLQERHTLICAFQGSIPLIGTTAKVAQRRQQHIRNVPFHTRVRVPPLAPRPGWLSGDSSTFVMCHFHIRGSSPLPGTKLCSRISSASEAVERVIGCMQVRFPVANAKPMSFFPELGRFYLLSPGWISAPL